MNKEFKVIGYYFVESDAKELAYDKLDFSVLTHLIYSFAIPTPDGEIRPFENPELVKKLVEYTHKNNRKILMAVGGWSYKDIPLEATFVEATDSQEKLEKLGDNIVKTCLEYGFDGVDVDWEHPRVSNGTYKQYEALVLYLSEKLHAHNKVLTSAVLGGVKWNGELLEEGASYTDKVVDAVDWLNVMIYDGGEGIKHSTYEFTVNSMNYWRKDRGAAKEKIVMGVPFYSYIPPRTYESILEADGEAWNKDMIVDDGQEFHYNGVATMAKKADYALEHASGIMFWHVCADTSNKEYSLLQTIGKQIKKHFKE